MFDMRVRGFLSRLHVQVVALCVDKPIYDVLFSARATAAGASEEVGRGRVDGEGEEVGGLREVGYEALVEEEVGEDEDVHEEDEEEDGHPGFGGRVDAARGILLRFDGAVEVLEGVVVEHGRGGRVVPEHDVGCVDGAHEKCAWWSVSMVGVMQ